MSKYLVRERSILCLIVAFLLAAAMVGLLCGLLPTCEEDPNPPLYIKQPWEYTRLPGNLTPVSYDLRVRTDLTNFVFTGSVEILVKCLEPTDLILIHGNGLTVPAGKTTLTRHPSGTAPKLAKNPWLSAPKQFIVIELDGKLKKDAQYRLRIEFQAPLLDDSRGYYWMPYKTASGEERYLASTFFDPVDARKAFPCFDEPALKATFKVTLDHEPKYHALANMPKSQPDQTLPDGWVRATFDESVVMPTYLVCYVISDFKHKATNTTNGVLFRVWAQEDYIDQVDYALEKGAAILDYFDDLYGDENKYPLAKMDMIGLPVFTAGAMENWGLITYRETALLYEKGVSSEGQKQRVCTIVAHELAHQWFGNLVTMEWWNNIWLNEGFASYVEYLGTVRMEKDWYMWDKFVLYDLHRAMATDALVTSRPMVTDVLTPSDINSMFDRISYQKGSSILRMMSHFLGNATFVTGLQNYLSALQYGSAKSSDLWEHLQKAATDDNIDLGDGVTVATIMDTWTLQMGFPLITVKRDYTDDSQITARVEQKRFLSDPNSDPKTKYPDLGYKWYVPVTYTTAGLNNFNTPSFIWLKPQDQSGQIQVPNGKNSEWLLVNANQKGMYRVNYDDRNWGMITQQLETLHTAIPTASRAALISDTFSLAMAAEISHSRALDLTRYLKEERDYVPWYAVASALGSIERNIMRKGAYGNYKKYMKDQITPMYEYVGWDSKGDHITSLSRGRAISMACQYGNEDCIQTSVALYKEWKDNIQQTLTPNIHPDMQATAFCTAIEAGGQDEWYFAFNLYQNLNISTSVKSPLLTAMACSKKPWILSTYLKRSLDSKIIRFQDREDVLTAVARNPVGLPLAWDFFRANWDVYRSGYGDTVFLLDSIISGITSYFNTEYELQMVKRFMADHPDQGTGARAFTESIAVIGANIRWMKDHYDSVDLWLDATVNKPKVWEEIRLPKSLIPEHYDLTIKTDLVNFIFNGSVNVIIECIERTSVILLHSIDHTFTAAMTTLTRIGGGPTPTFKEPWLYEPNQFVVVELNSYLIPGEKYSLYLEFQGPLEADLRGYYRMNYTTKAGEKRYLASTFFDPVDARKAFPCFDEPALKATFNITLEHTSQYHALANMPKIQAETLDDEWIRSTFEKSVVMSTYLVCYVVSDFVSVNTTTAHNVSFSVWTQEDLIDQADYALRVGSDVLDSFDTLYGMDIKYPLSKMDMIALPDFTAGAMENWGLITYRETALLYKKGESSEGRKQRVCTIVAHELAHQWFGNLVTMDWWDYIWLNEGFASYVEYVGTEPKEPDFEIWDKFVLYDLQRAMETDALVTSRPMVIPTSTPAEINSIFDRISYQKGSSVIRMMSYFLGEETFTKGLQYYLRARQYKTATNSDLWNYLQQAATEDSVDLGTGGNVSEIMKTWTEQMGFPTVTVKRTYGGLEPNKITATADQKRFLTDPASDTGSSKYQDLGYKWHVPLTYTTGADPDFENPKTKWMPTQENVELEGVGSNNDWLLVNVNERGFYRVNYDETNWKLLSTQLRTNHTVISTTSRSALISDAFNLARAGELGQAVALDLTGYLTQERDYVPWYTVNNNLGYINNNLGLTPANVTFKSYMRMQIQPMYDYVGWDNVGSHLQKLSRARAITMACSYESSNCTMEAENRYSSWMGDMEQNTVAADLQYIVFCTGIAEGGLDEWLFAFNIYTNNNYTGSTLKSNLQSAMACSQDVSILSRYLNAVLNTSLVFEQDGQTVVVAIASNPVGTELAWKFFQDHWAFFRKTYGNTVFLLDSLVLGLLRRFNTPEKLQEVQQFMAAHPDQGTGAQAFTQAVAEINANIRWMQQNYDKVEEWLDNFGSKTS